MPYVSILMPVYYGKCYLEEAIKSIQNQTFGDWELIVIIEYEAEKGIEEILETYVHKDERIIILKNSYKLGISGSLNRGLKQAKGKFAARMDADDISLPIRLEQQICYMKAHPEVDVCGSNIFHFNELTGITSVSNYPLYNELIKTYLFFTCPICHPTVVFKMEQVHKGIIFYDEKLCATEDYELWSRIASEVTFHNLHQPLLKYRDHDKNATNNSALHGHQIMINTMKKNFDKIGVVFTPEELQLLFEPTCYVEGQNKKYLLQLIRSCEKKLKSCKVPYPTREWKMAMDRFTAWARPSWRHGVVTYLRLHGRDKEAAFLERALYFAGMKEFLTRKWVQRNIE